MAIAVQIVSEPPPVPPDYLQPSRYRPFLPSLKALTRTKHEHKEAQHTITTYRTKTHEHKHTDRHTHTHKHTHTHTHTDTHTSNPTQTHTHTHKHTRTRHTHTHTITHTHTNTNTHAHTHTRAETVPDTYALTHMSTTFLILEVEAHLNCNAILASGALHAIAPPVHLLAAQSNSNPSATCVARG